MIFKIQALTLFLAVRTMNMRTHAFVRLASSSSLRTFQRSIVCHDPLSFTAMQGPNHHLSRQPKVSFSLVASTADAQVPASANVDATVAKEEDSNNKIVQDTFTAYVVNLSYATTLQEIHNLFSQHVAITKVYMPFDKIDTQRNKGYAFVSVSSREELEKVISALHETEMNGRTIFVTEAKPRGSAASADNASASSSSASDNVSTITKLYVGNISYDTSTDDLTDLFSPYGKITDVFIPVKENGLPRGFAFVTLWSSNIEDAIQQTDGVEFNGRVITVNKPLPKGQKSNNNNSNNGNNKRFSQYQPPEQNYDNSSSYLKLYVGNLSFDTTEDDLRALYEQYGTLSDVYLPSDPNSGRRRGFAFVSINAEDAPTAIEGTDGLELNGRTLRVNFAQPRN